LWPAAATHGGRAGAHLSNRSTTLSFLHFNVPHPPGGRVHVEWPPPLAGLTRYEQNALTVDAAVGRIVRTLEAAHDQDILLVVSSDHWLRVERSRWSDEQLATEFGGDAEVVRKVPLLVRRMRDTAPRSIEQPVNTVHTARLIEEFSRGPGQQQRGDCRMVGDDGVSRSGHRQSFERRVIESTPRIEWSFRDPTGRVAIVEGRVYRPVHEAAAATALRLLSSSRSG
jgi:hypothetical protein